MAITSKSSSKKSSSSTPDKKKSSFSSTSPSKQQQPPNGNNIAAGKYLLERLRILLHRLQSTTEILQNWPETQAQGDSAKVHADTATDLIASIRKIVLGLRSVERHVNGTGGEGAGSTATAQNSLQGAAVLGRCHQPRALAAGAVHVLFHAA